VYRRRFIASRRAACKKGIQRMTRSRCHFQAREGPKSCPSIFPKSKQFLTLIPNKTQKMQASIEISMYPLDADYRNQILAFIKALNTHPELEVRTNSMSTQIFGEYDILMDLVKKEMKTVFSTTNTAIMVLKIVNQDLS